MVSQRHGCLDRSSTPHTGGGQSELGLAARERDHNGNQMEDRGSVKHGRQQQQLLETTATASKVAAA